MTIDPRIPTMPGREHVGFFTDQADIDGLHQARSAVRCSASRRTRVARKGELCILPLGI